MSERMQLDADLTLEKAVNMARQSEVIKKQQNDLRGGGMMDIDAVIKGRKQKPFTHKTPQHSKHSSAKPQPSSSTRYTCYRCGKSPGHAKALCPARDVTCHTCGKRGPYSKVCKSTKTVHVVETDSTEDTPLFLGSVDAGLDPWFADLTIRNHKVRFKIDTGADVSVILAHIYHAITEGDSQA